MQALVVTCGPFEGRICENDDDDFVFKSEMTQSEINWLEKAGAKWRFLETDEGDCFDDEESNPEPELGLDCEIVTFGFYLECSGKYYIPREFVRPATTRDLIMRHTQISEVVSKNALLGRPACSQKKIIDLLKERNYIVNELWRREMSAQDPSVPRNVFLCHASVDKPFVRQVWSDLKHAGHKPWIDEFEIQVGDSIVQKISEGTTGAGELVLFLSKASINSAWVQREWSSALARQLETKKIRVLPAVIEHCEIPALLADVKYADFRGSYNNGLEALMNALR